VIRKRFFALVSVNVSLDRFQPFATVTQSIPSSMLAKGSLRPETAIRGGRGQSPLTDQEGDIRADCCGAE
jgi:hypothetical protein